jgi:hypothetical protein
MQKSKFTSTIVSVVLVTILVIVAFGLPYGTINVGFEGPKCFFYGANFRWSQYQGVGGFQLHKYQDAEDPIAGIKGPGGAIGDWTYWGAVATPNDLSIGRRSAMAITAKEWPQLGVQVESNLKFEDINRQGDPLGWNITDPMSGRRIEYWNKQLVKMSETNTTVTYQYNYTKESFILAPVEFVVGFYLIPSQTDTGGTWSHWREGEWQNVVTWFMLDFNIWDNAYKDGWLDDPRENMFTTTFNGTVMNQQRLYDYRGGFPIAGWIQGWQKAGFTSNFGQAYSDTWFDTRGKESLRYTDNELGSLKDILLAKVMFSPSLVGEFLSLYDSPDSSFSYQLSPSDITNVKEDTKLVKSPSSTMQKTMYFPINVQNFGTYTEGNVWNGFKIYYPSAYFRIRMIYGVYGTFTYLWTEQVTKPTAQGGLDYPEQIEIHGSTEIDTPGIGQFTLFGLPLEWIIGLIVIAVIVIITLNILSLMGIGGLAVLKVKKGKR